METKLKKDLNTGSHTANDLELPRSELLKERFLDINSKAQVTSVTTPINDKPLGDLIKKNDVAINSLNFNNCQSFVFDRLCAQQRICIYTSI